LKQLQKSQKHNFKFLLFSNKEFKGNIFITIFDVKNIF